MEKSKKRKFTVLASIVTLFLSLVMIVANAMVVVEYLVVNVIKSSSLLGKLAGMKGVGKIFGTVKDAYNSVATSEKMKLLVVIMAALLVAGILLLILSFKNFKKKNKKGESNVKNFRNFIMFVISIVAVALAVLAFMGAKKEFKDIKYSLPQSIKDIVSKFMFVKLVVFAYIGLGLIATVLFLVAGLSKKQPVKQQEKSKASQVFDMAPVANCPVEVVSTQSVLANYDTNGVSPIVMVVQDKLAKVNQLRAMGAITESQYNAAVSRLINSI